MAISDIEDAVYTGANAGTADPPEFLLNAPSMPELITAFKNALYEAAEANDFSRVLSPGRSINM